MKRILLATHGRMADGVLSAVQLIIGETAEVECINAYLDGKPPAGELKAYFDTVSQNDQVIILTDLLGGSVNKELFSYLERNNVFLVAGFNLAMALEVAAMEEDEEITEEFCRNLVETGRSQVVFVNDCHKAAVGKTDDLEEVFT